MRLLLLFLLSIIIVLAGDCSSSKLSRLRSLFSSESVRKATNGHGISAYILQNADAHQSEYLPDPSARIRYLSNFNGGTGIFFGFGTYAVITEEKAILWTDVKTQAEEQLQGTEWIVRELTAKDVRIPLAWIRENLVAGSFVGFDPDLFTYTDGKRILSESSKGGMNAAALTENLVDKMWMGRPEIPIKELITLSMEETGMSADQKLNLMRTRVAEKKCTAAVYTALEDIMWILNVRGDDVLYNPLAYSHLFVTQNEAHLFIDNRKLNAEVIEHLGTTQIHPYEDVIPWLTNFHEQQKENKQYRVFGPKPTNYAIGRIFGKIMVSGLSPAKLQKMVKTEGELKGARNSHIRDSALKIEFLYWLEQEIGVKGRQLTEIQVLDKVDEIRATGDKFIAISFRTNSAAGVNAGDIEHAASNQSFVTRDKVYLTDSGSHYRDGTTDLTRTVWMSNRTEIPEEFIMHNTLALKGLYNLVTLKFPVGTRGDMLNCLSRHIFWQKGLDFGHGSGHGIGHFLDVHQGPRLSPKPEEANVVRAGMIYNLESAHYAEGKWGTRMENAYEVIRAEVPSGSGDFLAFRDLTFIPYELNIIEKSLLSGEEIRFLNDYHDRVFAKVAPILAEKKKEKELEWLRTKCRHI